MSKNKKEVITFKKMSLVGTARAVKGLKGKCFSLESTFCGQCFNKDKCFSGNGLVAEQQRVRAAEAFIKRSEGKSKKTKPCKGCGNLVNGACTDVSGVCPHADKSAVPVSEITPLGIALRIKANNYSCSRIDGASCFGGRCPLRDGAGSCGVSSPRDTKKYAKRVSLIDAYIAENSPKVKTVNLRPNFVKALKDRVQIYVDTTAGVAKELQDICVANGVVWFSGKTSTNSEYSSFFIRDTSTGYCMVVGGDGIRYRPETDSFDQVTQVETPKTESYPNLREALKNKKQFLVECTPEFFVRLHPILEELDIPRFKMENKIVWINPIVFAFTYMGNHPSTYCMTAVIDKGIVAEYFPATDSFDSVEKVVVTPAPSEDAVVAKKSCKNCTHFNWVNQECPLTHNVSLGFVCGSWTVASIKKEDSSDHVHLGMTGKCCDNTGLSLTIGKQYAIIAVTDIGFIIKNDRGNIEEYAKERFQSIEPVETKKPDTEKVSEKVFWQYVLENDLKDYTGCRFGMCKVCPYAEDTGACLIPSKYPLLDRCNNVAMQSMARKQLEKSGLMTPSEIKSSEEMRIFFPARNVGKYFLLNLNEKESAHLKKLLDSNPGTLSACWSEPRPAFLQVKVPEYVWVVSDDGLLRQKSSTLNIKVIDQALKVEMVNSCGVRCCFDFCCTIDEAYALYKAGENK